jgi:pimeloyl-ACP methyl ester carboxylesterase
MALRPPDLFHAFVTAPNAKPERWMFFLHGILGSGANWRSFARQLVTARPDWGAVLVDLRLHGESQAGFPPPHTVATAAADVANLRRLVPGSVHGILGHSFGGKVAIELARQLEGAVEHVFVIDSTPSARPDARGSTGTEHIVDLLRNLPSEFADRQEFTAWMEARGVTRATAMWLAMNVRPVPNTTRFVFRVDVAGIREMLDDYFLLDVWDVLETPPGAMRTHVVVGGKSSIVDAADLARAERCPRLTVDTIPEAGHWVHADAPDALRAIVLRHMSS